MSTPAYYIYAVSGGPYGSTASNNTISVIDTSVNKVITSFTDQSYQDLGPPTIVLNGEYVLVPNKGGNSVLVIETSSNTIVQTITGFNSPYAIAASASTAYVTNNAGIIALIDLSQFPFVLQSKGGVSIPVSYSYAIAINSDQTALCVTTYVNDSILGIDLTKNPPKVQVVQNIPGGPVLTMPGVVFSKDGTLAYVLNQSNNNVLVVDISTTTFQSDIQVQEKGFKSPNAIAITPDGNWLYLTNSATGGVVLLSTSESQAPSLISCSGLITTGIAITPDQKYAYVSTTTNIIVTIDLTTNLVTGSPISVTTANPLGSLAVMFKPTTAKKHQDCGCKG